MIRITTVQFKEAATKIGCSVPVIKAVYKVETAGSGFLEDGRLKILFEGHVFYNQLSKKGFDADKLALKYPKIIYKKWTKKHYIGGAAEWNRMSSAIAVCKEIGAPEMLALNSASYGAFQIMGYNCTLCGFATAQEMITAWNMGGEPSQLDGFVQYLKKSHLDDELRNVTIANSTKERKAFWGKFAHGYNGPGYKGSLLYDWDDYDVKLEKEFQIETALAA
jgi:hypothetical protein